MPKDEQQRRIIAFITTTPKQEPPEPPLWPAFIVIPAMLAAGVVFIRWLLFP
jgi:hypothetical protein